jgi:hypothetical protein
MGYEICCPATCSSCASDASYTFENSKYQNLQTDCIASSYSNDYVNGSAPRFCDSTLPPCILSGGDGGGVVGVVSAGHVCASSQCGKQRDLMVR